MRIGNGTQFNNKSILRVIFNGSTADGDTTLYHGVWVVLPQYNYNTTHRLVVIPWLVVMYVYHGGKIP